LILFEKAGMIRQMTAQNPYQKLVSSIFNSLLESRK